MRTLTVALSDRSYDIRIGSSLLEESASIAELLPSNRVVVVSNSVVAPLYLEQLVTPMRRVGIETSEIILPDGESYKNWETLNTIFDRLLTARCDRTTTLIALGGGVVGDLAGFAAASYQRGIPFIQVPTTLLAQVDSSVGGKTGINHPRGKNMIGAFWQPRLVLADTATLNTLPDRQLAAGMAEVIKYGLIKDLPFLDWLESNMDKLLARDPDALAYAIERSCANKAEVVAGDERETAKSDGRALLNLGHTFGHAIETGVGYGQWLHGEAVAAGTIMATELSHMLGWITDTDVERVRVLFRRAKLPTRGAPLTAERYLDLMGHDKKVFAGKLRLVLLKRLGEAITTAEVSPADIRIAIDTCCA
jgi:3-dehydroquinate synthase